MQVEIVHRVVGDIYLVRRAEDAEDPFGVGSVDDLVLFIHSTYYSFLSIDSNRILISEALVHRPHGTFSSIILSFFVP